MTVIMVTSPKGGVGVTTVAAELARHLARGGTDVVAVDLSGQPALGYRLGAGEADDGPASGPSAMPGGLALREAAADLPRGRARAEFALAQARPDTVVITDVAAGDRETRDALMPHAGLTLCVLAADAGSLAVLPQAVQLRGACHLLNLVDERRAVAADAVSVMARLFGDRLLGVIRQDEAINEALALLGELPAGSAAANDFARVGAVVESLLAGLAAPSIGNVA